MVRVRPISAAALLLIAALAPLGAHHSVTADYDLNAPIAVHGPLVKVEWTNPHAHISVDVTTANGTIETWQVETAAPRFLVGVGLTREMLAIGTIVDIKGLRAKNGSHKAYGQEMMLRDGIARKLYTQQDLLAPRPKAEPATRSTWQTLANNLWWSPVPYMVVTAAILAAVVGVYVRRRNLARG